MHTVIKHGKREIAVESEARDSLIPSHAKPVPGDAWYSKLLFQHQNSMGAYTVEEEKFCLFTLIEALLETNDTQDAQLLWIKHMSTLRCNCAKHFCILKG